MTATLLVICEARVDFQIATDLADRILRAGHTGTIIHRSPEYRWHESAPGQHFICWKDLDKVAEALGIRRLRPRSRFGGVPGAAFDAAADKALLLASSIQKKEGLVGVLLICDSDGDEKERRSGLTQARTAELNGPSWPFGIVIGLPHPMAEAWVLAGFEPQDAAELKRLAELTQEIGRNPCFYSHELGNKSSPRDIKRILKILTNHDGERQAICWQQAPLSSLRERGQNNGLAAYLTEIDERIVSALRA